MKTFTKLANPILLLCISIFLFSCSKNLSRDKAKDEITKKMGYPIPITYSFGKHHKKDYQMTGRGPVNITLGEKYEDVKQMLSFFQDKGVIVIKEEPRSEEQNQWLFGYSLQTWIDIQISISETGRQYLKSENENSITVQLWYEDIDKISGIQEIDKNNSEATFTTINKNITPFGEYFNSDYSHVKTKTVSFSLFDDGWRIN